ncbi:MAG: hypothetical protein PHH00_02075 [Candidatus Nanoarchaeia archaeon]|nr:hypothetical protein [Candidatus Nanoarchaeia archaeon]
MFLLISLVSAETTFFDNPDDAFVMSSAAESTGSAAEGITGRVTGGTATGNCSYNWDCTNWSLCLSSEKQTRNCTNTGTCPDAYKTPKTEQDCIHSVPTASEWDKESGETTPEKIAGRNKMIVYTVIPLIAIFFILYLKKVILKRR